MLESYHINRWISHFNCWLDCTNLFPKWLACTKLLNPHRSTLVSKSAFKAHLIPPIPVPQATAWFQSLLQYTVMLLRVWYNLAYNLQKSIKQQTIFHVNADTNINVGKDRVKKYSQLLFYNVWKWRVYANRKPYKMYLV